VQGTLDAARAALDTGIAGNLAGGTHHAFAGHGEGFCVLNDVAVAIRVLQAERRIARALIVDLDVHQGDGTATIVGDDPTIHTLSIHGRNNFPFHKEASRQDVELDDGTGDEAYLAVLAVALPLALERSRPDLAIYLAGADP
jgi:acetoin utilization deacetylase AcuC-like enzyme